MNYTNFRIATENSPSDDDVDWSRQQNGPTTCGGAVVCSELRRRLGNTPFGTGEYECQRQILAEPWSAVPVLSANLSTIQQALIRNDLTAEGITWPSNLSDSRHQLNQALDNGQSVVWMSELPSSELSNGVNFHFMLIAPLSSEGGSDLAHSFDPAESTPRRVDREVAAECLAGEQALLISDS